MNVRPEYNFKTIGSNLKNLRQSNRLTVEQVREYLCLGSVQAIYKWERGEGLPQADTLFALMELYRVTDINTIKGESAMLSPVYVLAAVICTEFIIVFFSFFLSVVRSLRFCVPLDDVTITSVSFREII